MASYNMCQCTILYIDTEVVIKRTVFIWGWGGGGGKGSPHIRRDGVWGSRGRPRNDFFPITFIEHNQNSNWGWGVGAMGGGHGVNGGAWPP